MFVAALMEYMRPLERGGGPGGGILIGVEWHVNKQLIPLT